MHGGHAAPASLDAMLVDYQQVGITMNEMNRSVGLADSAPEMFVPPVIAKLRFVHRITSTKPGQLGNLRPTGPTLYLP
ncbi:MAG: putative zinc-binding metallopeptidase [Pirellulales bacterium]